MYYKIENKESRVYRELYAMRIKELMIERDNQKAIAEKIPYGWNEFYGRSGQQNFKRVTRYVGFCFIAPEKVNLKVWKKDKKHPGFFIPNTKTEAGKDMDRFLLNGLKGGAFTEPWDILGVECVGRFSFPFVEVVGDVIVLFLDDKQKPADENVIEITKKEFDAILVKDKSIW